MNKFYYLLITSLVLSSISVSHAEVLTEEKIKRREVQLKALQAEQAKKAEQARKAAEQAKKAEQARKAAEQAKKAEQARKAAEQAKKAEQARKAAEQAKKAEQARKAAEQAKKAEQARKAPLIPKVRPAYVTIEHNNFKFVVLHKIQRRYPEIIDLILHTESMENNSKQQWLTLLPSMTNDQIDRLFEILITERHKLERIELQFYKDVKKANEEHMRQWRILEQQKKKKK